MAEIGEIRNTETHFVRKPEAGRPGGRHWCRLESSENMYFKERGYNVDWINVAQDKKWRSVVNTAELRDGSMKSANGSKESVPCSYGLTFNNCS